MGDGREANFAANHGHAVTQHYEAVFPSAGAVRPGTAMREGRDQAITTNR
jgi:hypothetical protein